MSARDDVALEPPAILAVFTAAQRILEPVDVALALGISREHPARYAELRARLRLMARAGWLAEQEHEGRVRYMAAYAQQLALPPGLVELLEAAVGALTAGGELVP